MKALIFIFFISIGTCAVRAQIAGDSIPCYGTQQVYTLSGGSGFFFWSVSGGNLSQNLAGGSFMIQWTSVGTYTITCIYTDIINPDKIDTSRKTIIVMPQPDPLISVLNSQSACQYVLPNVGGEIKEVGSGTAQTTTCYSVCDSGWYIYAAQGFAGSSFSWYTAGSNIITHNASGDTASVDWIAPLPPLYTTLQSTELTVVETTIAGCKDSSSICISVNGKPHACFSTSPQDSSGIVSICKGGTVTFSDSCTWVPQWLAHPSSIIDRTWILGDGTVVQNQSVVTHQYQSSGNYTVFYIAQSNCYCADTFRMTVHVNSGFGPTIQCISTVCHDSWTAYYVNDTCSHTYYWTVTGADSIWSSQDSLYVKWGSCDNGYGTIAVRTDCPSYCPYESVVRVPVIPANASIVGPSTVCRNDNVLFSAPFVPGTAYEWFGPDTVSGVHTGIIPSDSNTHIFTHFGSNIHHIPEPSYIAVAYSNLFLGCSGFSVAPISVAAGIQINYLIGDSVICYQDTLQLASVNNISHSPVSCNWSVYSTTTSSRVDTISNNVYYNNNSLAPGTYIIYAYPDTGIFCSVPVSTLLTVSNQPPYVSAPVIGSDTICPNILFTYYSTPTNSSEYYLQWTTVRGTPAIGSGDQFSVAWSTPLPDTLFVSQVMLQEPGCVSAPVFVVVHPDVNEHPTLSGDTTVCSDAIVSYKTSFAADAYAWTITPAIAGSVTQGASSDSISIQWNHFISDTTAYLLLIATRCGYPDSSTIRIHITPQVQPTISVSPSPPYCTGKNITFTASSGGTNYGWNFGDGSTSSGSSNTAVHQFNNDSAYTVRVTISSSSQCLSNSPAITTVNIFPSPAAFLSTPQNTNHCGDPLGWKDTLYVTLQNMSALGFSYQFFDNGSAVTGSGNSYITTKTGSYYAIVTTSAGCTGNTDTVTIDSVCATSGCSTPYSISFTDHVYCDSVVFSANTNANVTFTSWDFGDPTSGANDYSSVSPAYHLYTQAGYYHTTVYGTGTASSGSGTCDISYQWTDTVPLVAKFLAQFSCEHGTMHTQLIDLSTYVHSISSWHWYVNGTLSYTTQNVDTPMSAGIKTITLVISDSTNTCSISQTINVPSPPVANFTYTDSQCITTPINLYPTDTTNIVSYLWDFGDGSYSGLQNTSKIYGNCFGGHFGSDECDEQITLTETDKYGCTDSVSATIYYFSDPFAGKTLSLTPSLIELCANNTQPIVATISSGSLNGDNFVWNNGYSGTTDTQYVNEGGSYSVTVSNDRGCTLASPNPTSVIFNTVQGIIIGDTNYCYNEYSDLNIFEGFQYQYFWIYEEGNSSTNYSTIPSSHGYSFNKLVTTASPGYPYYKVWGVIRDSLSSSSFCDDTIGPVNIHMYPFKRGVSSGYSLCIAQGPATFIAGQYAGYSVLWNTGLLSDTLITSIPGTYFAEYIDTNGCIDSLQSVFTAFPAPDLSELVVGCYNFCLGDTPKLYVPTDMSPSASGLWLFNGMPLSSVYTFDPAGDIYALQSGSYQFVLTNSISGSPSCTDTSQPVYISFVSCSDSCFKHASIFCSNCYYDSASGNHYINLLISISDTIPIASSINLLSQDLSNINYWPAWLPANYGGTDYINVQGVADSTSNGQYCVEITFNGCHQAFCVNASSMPCSGVVAERHTERPLTRNKNRNAFKKQNILRYE